MDERSYKITKAVEKYRGDLSPRSGDCGNIASAMVEFFDDATLVSVSNDGEKHNSVHFCVRINRKLYDGFGLVSQKEIVEEFAEDENINNPKNYLYDVPSVESENYILFNVMKNDIIKNLNEEFK